MGISKYFGQSQKDGHIEISPGVYLYSREHITDAQETWHEGDQAKSFDFSSSDYWITTNSGDEPLAIDISEYLEEYI